MAPVRDVYGKYTCILVYCTAICTVHKLFVTTMIVFCSQHFSCVINSILMKKKNSGKIFIFQKGLWFVSFKFWFFSHLNHYQNSQGVSVIRLCNSTVYTFGVCRMFICYKWGWIRRLSVIVAVRLSPASIWVGVWINVCAKYVHCIFSGYNIRKVCNSCNPH